MQPTIRAEHERLAAQYPGHVTMVHDGRNYTLADGSTFAPAKLNARLRRLTRNGQRAVYRPYRGEIRIMTPGSGSTD